MRKFVQSVDKKGDDYGNFERKNTKKTSSLQPIQSGYMSLRFCHACPHSCGVDRREHPSGYCRSGASCSIASIWRHTGEEPVISGRRGICNVFFARCNMQCIYCQNHEISRNTGNVPSREMTPHEVAAEIIQMLPQCENRVGFVTASHDTYQVVEIINCIRSLGANPVFVFNSNGYDRPETLRLLEGKIDVYLPDFKYSDALLGKQLSDVADYPRIALSAIREMYRQKGSTLLVDEDTGLAESGLIIRHLVLPGLVEQSIETLRLIAEEISVSVHISLMSQYYPPFEMTGFPDLNRTLYPREYDRVVDAFHRLGFYRGWIQDLESTELYRPRFNI